MNWGLEEPQILDTFVIGRNQELAQLLRLFVTHPVAALRERFVYLWGDSGAGKTHLLHALATAPSAR